MRKKIEETINLIRPALQADGGDVELVDSAAVTLHHGIEKFLKEKVPEVVRVEAVT